MVNDRCNSYFSFWAIFYPFTAQKIKIKKKKNARRYHHFTYVYQKWCSVPEIWCATDRQIDRQIKKVTHRGGCPT